MTNNDLAVDYDYLASQSAQAVETVEQIQQSLNLNIVATAVGQIAIFNGSAFVAGGLFGDSNGISVAQVSSPSFGLQVSLAQDLRTAASPSFQGLTIGTGGTLVKKILAGTVSVNPASIPATTTGTADFGIAGAAIGDILILNRPDGLNDDLIFSGCRIISAGNARLYLYNPTAGAIDDGALDWTYCLIDVT